MRLSAAHFKRFLFVQKSLAHSREKDDKIRESMYFFEDHNRIKNG